VRHRTQRGVRNTRNGIESFAIGPGAQRRRRRSRITQHGSWPRAKIVAQTSVLSSECRGRSPLARSSAWYTTEWGRRVCSGRGEIRLSRMTSDPRSASSHSKLHRHCDSRFSDANADANRRSEPVGCCRSDRPVCIQETVADGSCRVMRAFWKCGIPRQAVSRVRIPLAPHFA